MDRLTGCECRQMQAVPVEPHARACMEILWTSLHLPTLHETRIESHGDAFAIPVGPRHV